MMAHRDLVRNRYPWRGALGCGQSVFRTALVLSVVFHMALAGVLLHAGFFKSRAIHLHPGSAGRKHPRAWSVKITRHKASNPYQARKVRFHAVQDEHFMISIPAPEYYKPDLQVEAMPQTRDPLDAIPLEPASGYTREDLAQHREDSRRQPDHAAGASEVEEAAVLYQPAPEYPAVAQRRGYEGTVTVEIEVDAQGGVSRCTVTHSSAYRVLDHAVVTAVRQWRFSPVRHRRIIVFHFRLSTKR